MRQMRSRIREKRGVDYTEDEIRELASVKLEKFLDPKGVRSDLLEQYRKRNAMRRRAPRELRVRGHDALRVEPSAAPVRSAKLLNPILKLFFNPNPMIEALHIQSKLNDSYNQAEALYYELIHNLVLETTRLGIEVKNLKMRVESMSSRLDFDERRARALEGVVQYRPGAVAPLQPPAGGGATRSSLEATWRRTTREPPAGDEVEAPADRGAGDRGADRGGGQAPRALGERGADGRDAGARPRQQVHAHDAGASGRPTT